MEALARGGRTPFSRASDLAIRKLHDHIGVVHVREVVVEAVESHSALAVKLMTETGTLAVLARQPLSRRSDLRRSQRWQRRWRRLVAGDQSRLMTTAIRRCQRQRRGGREQREVHPEMHSWACVE
jgi:hypothetical protein